MTAMLKTAAIVLAVIAADKMLGLTDKILPKK